MLSTLGNTHPNLNITIAKHSERSHCRKVLFLSLLKTEDELVSQLVGRRWKGGEGRSHLGR